MAFLAHFRAKILLAGSLACAMKITFRKSDCNLDSSSAAHNATSSELLGFKLWKRLDEDIWTNDICYSTTHWTHSLMCGFRGSELPALIISSYSRSQDVGATTEPPTLPRALATERPKTKWHRHRNNFQ